MIRLRSVKLRLLAAAAALATAVAPLAAQEAAHGGAHGAGQTAGDTVSRSAAVGAAINRSLVGDSAGLRTGRHDANATQAHGAAAGNSGHGAAGGDIIMPHITDSRHLEIPWPSSHLAREVELPHFAPVRLGGLTIDLSPTKHVVMMLLASVLCAVTLITAAAAHKRHSHAVGRPKGFAAGIEAVVLFVRDEVILKNVGHHGNAFVPYLLATFFFILFANILGLIPYGSTATGNISVTAALAVLAFIVIEVAGMRALGKDYIGTILYWPSDMKNGPMKVFLSLILSPVELLGKFTKPFALAIRLFANMTAGHVIVLAFIGMIFTFGSYLVAVGPVLMALAIMLLEVFVALLQAYIFTLLVSVFIGQIREAHH
jgi:F-type H+-transporting ATPase subunit a